MAESLGEAVLDLEADLTPLDRDLAEAERRTAAWLATTQAMLDRGMGPVSQRIGMVGQAFDRDLTPPLERFGAATERMAKQVDGSLAQTRLEQAATAREAERAATIAEAAGRAQVGAAERVARAYAEEAAAAKLSADVQESSAARARAARAAFGAGGYPAEGHPHAPPPGSTFSRQAVEERLAIRGGAEPVWGVRGPRAAGSIGNPIVMVMEAANRTGLGSLAAAIGESSASGGARSTVVADSGGGPAPTTIIASSGGAGGGGVPPVAVAPSGSSGGGGGGGFFTGLGVADAFMGRGGGGGGGGRAPGWLGFLLGPALGATAAAGSAGSFAGLGPEHLLLTLLGLGGSAVGAGIGGGLLAAGSAGQIAVGGGSDLAVLKSTIADTKALGEGYANVQKAVGKYGAESKQAAMAQHELNMLMAELGGGAGVKAEVSLAKQTEALNHFWDQQTQSARVQAVGILSQFVTLAHEYVPRVADAAQVNLAVINTGIKPLLSWLSGPQGLGIFNNLEDRFRAQLPTAIHAGTQALEFFLRVIDAAAQYTGGFVRSVDHLFTRLNSADNSTLSGWVGKFVADFRMWEALIKVVGEDLFLLFSRDAGTAAAIVTGVTHALERVREWEKSTRGGAQIQSIFMVHREQIEALGHLIPPLVGAFSKLYLAVAPTAVEATITLMTKVLLPFVETLSWVASQGKAAAVAMGLLLISFKAFGIGSTLSGLKSMFEWLTGAETANAAAGNADAAAQERLAGAEAAVGVAGAGAAAGAGEAGAAEGAAGAAAGVGAGGGLLARLAAPGAAVAETGGVLGAMGLARSGGLLEGAGGLLARALPVGVAGGAGFLATNFIANATGLHGSGKGLLEGAGTGAGIGLALGGPLGALAGAGIGAGGYELGKLLGLFGESKTVEINHFNDALKSTPQHIQALLDSLKGAGGVKIDGVSQSIKLVRAELEKAKHTQEVWNAGFNKSWEAVHNFSLGAGPLLKELYDRFDTNFKLIAHTMGLNSAAGRKQAEDNVGQMVDHIGRAIHSGAIPVGTGMQAISNVIAKYASATGDETPRIYELMFSKIGVLYKRGEIGASTAFHAYSSIASTETKHMASIVESTQRDMFAHLKTLYDNGEITTQQYHSKERSVATHTASIVEGAMGRMAEGVIGAIEAGALSSKDGLSIIGKNLNQLLGQFGAKPLPTPKLEAYVAVAGANKAAAKVLHGLEGFAGGGMVQFGQPGERGHDSIFLNMGGSDIAVAPGEVGAIFNHHQLPEVNAALEERGWGGGLAGLFGGITTPHYMATGGFTPRQAYPGPMGRIDQGVDFTTPGPIRAVMDGVVTHVGLWPGWPGTGGLVYSTARGNVYDMEHVLPQVRMGQHVNAGQVVGQALAGYPWLETGWANASSTGPLTTYAGAPDGTQTSGGKSFASFLGGGPGSGVAGGALSLPTIHAPQVSGTGGPADIARAALHRATSAANRYLQLHGAASAAGFSGTGGGGQLHGEAGRYGRTQLEALWRAAGGAPALAHLMAAIALAESAGDPQAHNASGATGLWQILGVPFPGNAYDPFTNARMAVAKYKSQGLGAWETYTNGAYRQFMSLGGLVRMARGGLFAGGGGAVGRAAAVPKVGRPKGVAHVKRPGKPHQLSLKHLITTLGAIPGMGHLRDMLGPQEGTYNLLGDEETLLGGMTSNPASILAADMSYLSPTLVPGEDIGPGMLVPHAERELQRALQAHGESPALTLQGSLLQWIGGLDDHRLLSGPDIAVLAKDFKGTSGHHAIHGVPFAAGYPVFKGEQSVLEAQVQAQLALVHLQRMEKDRAVRFIRSRQRRKQRIEAVLKAVYRRYQNIQRRLALLKTAGLRRKLSQAQQQHAAAVAHQQEVQDVSAHRLALRDAIANEQQMNPWERNEGLLHTWQAEERHLGGVLSKPPPSTAAISNAQEALERNELQGELKPLSEQLHLLGGSTSSIGHGGEWAIETKQLSGLHTGAAELDEKIRESVQSTIPQLQLSIAGIKDSLAEEAESVPPAAIPQTGAVAETELASLLKQQNEQLAQQLAVSQAQYKVFAGLDSLPPFAGRFHSGGVVPGPLGAERMALVQGGEIISQPGATMETHLHVADGMGWLKDLIRVEVRKRTGRDARDAGRPLPSRGGGLLTP